MQRRRDRNRVHLSLLQRLHKNLLRKVNILLIILQLSLQFREPLPILLIRPRVAESKPVLLGSLLEIKAERDLDALFFGLFLRVMHGGLPIGRIRGCGPRGHPRPF